MAEVVLTMAERGTVDAGAVQFGDGAFYGWCRWSVRSMPGPVRGGCGESVQVLPGSVRP